MRCWSWAACAHCAVEVNRVSLPSALTKRLSVMSTFWSALHRVCACFPASSAFMPSIAPPLRTVWDCL